MRAIRTRSRTSQRGRTLLTEREHHRPDPGVEKLDLERAIGDATSLSNELIETRLADLTGAVGGRIDSVCVSRGGAVQRHLESNGPSVLPRSQDEVQIAAMEPEGDAAARRFEHGALGTDLP